MRISYWSSDVCSFDLAWLDDVVARAVAVAPADRFGDAVEMLRALEGGPALVSASPSRFRPLIERGPLRFWQIMQIGRAPWRERVGPYVSNSGVAVLLKNKNRIIVDDVVPTDIN